jgi:hypothetical protein
MPKRDPLKRMRLTGCFDPFYAPAQGRKRAYACAGHAPLLKEDGAATVSREPEAGSFVHGMF